MKDHFMLCEHCKQQFDMRDLCEVFHHTTKICMTGEAKKDIPYLSSIRVGDNVEWTKDKKKIDLN